MRVMIEDVKEGFRELTCTIIEDLVMRGEESLPGVLFIGQEENYSVECVEFAINEGKALFDNWIEEKRIVRRFMVSFATSKELSLIGCDASSPRPGSLISTVSGKLLTVNEGGVIRDQSGKIVESIKDIRESFILSGSLYPQVNVVAPMENAALKSALQSTERSFYDAEKQIDTLLKFVKSVADLSIWDYGHIKDECEAPSEGHQDSHECLMDKIEEARRLIPGMDPPVQEDYTQSTCGKCGSPLEGDYCSDEVCPYSEWPQQVQLHMIELMPASKLLEQYKLTPRIRVHARAFTESNRQEVSFDAAPWLKQATLSQIVELFMTMWQDEKKVVAEFCRSINVRVADIFEQPESVLCNIDAFSAMEWLKQHRIDVWGVILCKEKHIFISEKQDGWYWFDKPDNLDRGPFSNIGDAAHDAILKLELHDFTEST